MLKNSFPKSGIFYLLLFISKVTLAQKNLQNGYIISLSGDTVKGYVDYRNWEKNPKKLSFIKDNESRIYSPLDIKEFGTMDEIYVSAIVTIEDSPFKPEEVDYTPQLNMKQDTAFLQTIIKGPKSLYYYKDARGKTHFFIWNNNNYELLLYKQFKIKNSNGIFLTANKHYIQQLKQYFNDCQGLATSDLSRLSYNTKSLNRVFYNYFECKKELVRFQKKEDKIKTESGILIGLSGTKVDFTSEMPEYSYLDKANFKQKVNLSGGIFIDIILPRNMSKWSITNELIMTSYRSDASFKDYVRDENYTLYYSKLASTTIKLNNLLRYRFGYTKNLMYVNAGISNGLSVASTNELIKERTFYTTQEKENLKAVDPFRKHEQAILFGLGGKLGRLSIEARVELGNGMADSENLNSKITKIGLLFGYNLL